MKLSGLKVGYVVRAVIEDHNIPDLADVDGGELTFEAFGRIVRVHPRSIILQTWGNIPVSRRATLDDNTEMLRLLKADIREIRRLM